MIGGIIDLTELQHKIEELQGVVRVKPRIASLDDAHKLLEQGYDIEWISRKSGIPESKIAEYEEEKRIFLATTRLPSKRSAYGFICGTSMTTFS